MGIFADHASAFYCQQARKNGIQNGHTGSVLFLQRSGSHEIAEQEPLLSACANASVQHRIALGPRAGRGVTRLGAEPLRKWAEANVEIRGRLHAHHDGFDLHAKQLIHANDRQQLERTLRYCARPPLSEDRVELLANANVRVRVKKPWADGTTHLELTAFEFLEKLAALVPPARKNLLIYRGVLAPNHKLRAQVVAYGRRPGRSQPSGETTAKASVESFTANAQHGRQPPPDSADVFGALPVVSPRPVQLSLSLHATEPEHSPGDRRAVNRDHPRSASNRGWAFLMQRAFSFHVLACGCGRRLKYIGCLTDAQSIDATLERLGLLDPATAPATHPPRAPPPKPPRPAEPTTCLCVHPLSSQASFLWRDLRSRRGRLPCVRRKAESETALLP